MYVCCHGKTLKLSYIDPFPDLLHYRLCPFDGCHFGSHTSIECNEVKDNLCLFHKNA